MAFDPALVQYPIPNLQHMFARHKADWGFAGRNWNTATGIEFRGVLEVFIAGTPTVHAGTYHGEDAWLVVEQDAPNKCAIIHRPNYNIWSGWNLSPAQFQHANNPPYSLGGGLLLVFGDLLEQILGVKDHDKLESLAQIFIDTYKATTTTAESRLAENTDGDASQKALVDLFAVLDNYAPPALAKRISGSGVTSDINAVKHKTEQALAILEKGTAT